MLNHILYYTVEVFETARGRSDHDRMVVGFTSTNAITCEFESCSWQGVFDTTLCDKVCQ